MVCTIQIDVLTFFKKLLDLKITGQTVRQKDGQTDGQDG